MANRRYKAAVKDFFYQSGRGTGKGSSSDQRLRLVIRLDGRLDEDLLEKALHAMIKIDPILGCTFVDKGLLRGSWECSPDIDALKLCHMIQTADEEKTVSQFLTSEGIGDRGPYFRIGLIRSAASDTLCLITDHRLADGGGLKELAYLLADLYRRMVENHSVASSLTVGRFKKRTAIGLARYRGPLNPPEKPWAFHRSPFKLPYTDTRNTDPFFALRSVPPEDFLRLKDYGRSRGATVNDLLIAALIRSLWTLTRLPEGRSFALHVSCDYRSRLPKEVPYPICNLFGIHFPEFVCRPGESFEDTLSSVVARMSEIRCESTLENAIREEYASMNALRDIARNSGWPLSPPPSENPTTHVILSNFTVIDEKRLYFDAVPVKDAYELGTVSFGTEFMLCASTYKNRLTLSHGSCRSDIDPSVVDRIMDDILAELRSVLPKEK